MKNMDSEEIEKLMTTVGDGVLALAENNVPYCIPFGFVYIEGRVYLSMFPMGKKWEMYKKNDKVCFNVFCWKDDHSEWYSVVIDGKMVQVKDLKVIEKVVLANMKKVGLDETHLQKRMAYYEKNIDNPKGVKIFRIETENMTGIKMHTLIGS